MKKNTLRNYKEETEARQPMVNQILWTLAKKGIVRNRNKFILSIMNSYSKSTITNAMTGGVGMTPTLYKAILQKIHQLPDHPWHLSDLTPPVGSKPEIFYWRPNEDLIEKFRSEILRTVEEQCQLIKMGKAPMDDGSGPGVKP